MMNQPFNETEQGFAVYGLQNEAVEIRILPELGAKICSLRNRATGREWMWTPPDRGELFRNRTGDPFDQSTIMGADECIPTIAPCTWRGRDLPDHGEVWTESWTVDEEAFDNGELKTYLQFPISPLEMERTITLDRARVEMTYRVTNIGDEPIEYIWALHPLMTIHEGDCILLPHDVQTVRTDSADKLPWQGRGVALDWPSPGHAIAFDRLDLGGEGAAIKLFTEPLSQGRAAIRNERSGDYLVYTFNPAALDTLGIWINRGGWNGYHHVALEPGNGAPDLLSLAVEDWGRFARLQSRETHRWVVNLYLGVDAETEAERFLAQFNS